MAAANGAGDPVRRHLVLDERRLNDVELKHDRVRVLLQESGADALLLQDPVNIAWFTAGADPSRFGVESCQTSVFITEDARLFATNSVDSALLFEREAFGLGFQLKQREWFQPHRELVDDLCRGRRVLSDSDHAPKRQAARLLADLRLPLTPLEVDRLRRLSRVVTHAVEVSAANARPGMTEAAIAGEIAHRLVKRTVNPVRIQVAADGRLARFRHWAFGEEPVERFATISCIARRWGLHAAVTRTVCLGHVPDELWQAYQKLALVHGTALYFTRNTLMLQDVWKRVQRIYEKFGLPCEWLQSDQADVIGYRASEHRLTPDSSCALQEGVPVFWHPSVGEAATGDTLLVTARGPELLTRSARWPEMSVLVKGHGIPVPGLLRVRTSESSSEPKFKAVPAGTSASLFDATGIADDDHDDRMDSIWELDLTSERSIFEEDESAYSEESVFD
ncbi:MAG: M24 family metallopeptidase [Planctomycetaceae bacterium]|nr:M24 family metallopeptidase [Planctomycetaceae bacterium]